MTALFFNCDLYCRQFVSVSFTPQAFLSRVTPNNFPENLITSLGRATFFYLFWSFFAVFVAFLWRPLFVTTERLPPFSLHQINIASVINGSDSREFHRFHSEHRKNKDKITQSCLVALMLQSCCEQVAVTSRCINVASHSVRLYFQLRIPSSLFPPKNRPS